mgnify:CR=1 FL=1
MPKGKEAWRCVGAARPGLNIQGIQLSNRRDRIVGPANSRVDEFELLDEDSTGEFENFDVIY